MIGRSFGEVTPFPNTNVGVVGVPLGAVGESTEPPPPALKVKVPGAVCGDPNVKPEADGAGELIT